MDVSDFEAEADDEGADHHPAVTPRAQPSPQPPVQPHPRHHQVSISHLSCKYQSPPITDKTPV
jgi:hypothetical protein